MKDRNSDLPTEWPAMLRRTLLVPLIVIGLAVTTPDSVPAADPVVVPVPPVTHARCGFTSWTA